MRRTGDRAMDKAENKMPRRNYLPGHLEAQVDLAVAVLLTLLVDSG